MPRVARLRAIFLCIMSAAILFSLFSMWTWTAAVDHDILEGEWDGRAQRLRLALASPFRSSLAKVKLVRASSKKSSRGHLGDATGKRPRTPRESSSRVQNEVSSKKEHQQRKISNDKPVSAAAAAKTRPEQHPVTALKRPAAPPFALDDLFAQARLLLASSEEKSRIASLLVCRRFGNSCASALLPELFAVLSSIPADGALDQAQWPVSLHLAESLVLTVLSDSSALVWLLQQATSARLESIVASRIVELRDEEAVRMLLADDNPEVRSVGVELAGEVLEDLGREGQEDLFGEVREDHPMVREAVLRSSGEVGEGTLVRHVKGRDGGEHSHLLQYCGESGGSKMVAKNLVEKNPGGVEVLDIRTSAQCFVEAPELHPEAWTEALADLADGKLLSASSSAPKTKTLIGIIQRLVGVARAADHIAYRAARGSASLPTGNKFLPRNEKDRAARPQAPALLPLPQSVLGPTTLKKQLHAVLQTILSDQEVLSGMACRALGKLADLARRPAPLNGGRGQEPPPLLNLGPLDLDVFVSENLFDNYAQQKGARRRTLVRCLARLGPRLAGKHAEAVFVPRLSQAEKKGGRGGVLVYLALLSIRLVPEVVGAEKGSVLAALMRQLGGEGVARDLAMKVELFCVGSRVIHGDGPRRRQSDGILCVLARISFDSLPTFC